MRDNFESEAPVEDNYDQVIYIQEDVNVTEETAQDIENVTTDMVAYVPEAVPTQEYDANGVEIGL